MVAEEVRNLAMRAADAASNTQGLIEGTVKKVKDGAGLMTGTREAFGKVAESASKVAELLAEIAAASKEQSQGIAQVNTAMVDMDKVTQQNAATAEESTAAVVELTSQAEQMKTMVEDLLRLIGGQAKAKPRKKMEKGKAKEAKLRSPAAAAAVKPVRSAKKSDRTPEQVIPLESEDFKDF